MVKCRVGPGHLECGDQKGIGVSADTDNDPRDGVGGEGRVKVVSLRVVSDSVLGED